MKQPTKVCIPAIMVVMLMLTITLFSLSNPSTTAQASPPVSVSGTETTTSPSAPPKPRILPNHSSYVTSSGYLHIVGEVYNDTPDHLRYVKITANILDSSGQLLDTDYNHIPLDDLPAGDKTCFHISLKEPAGWSYYEFETPGYWKDGKPLPRLTVLDDSGSYNSTCKDYEIIGQVRNGHGTRVEYVSPVGTLYNAAGTVIGCNAGYVNGIHLDPAQTGSFKIAFGGWHRDFADVASYRLQVDGDPQQK